VRLLERLEQLYAIGGGPGANRLGGSPQEDEAHDLVAGWMHEAGLEVERDEAGNLYGRLRGRKLETGSYRITLHATDAAGNVSAPARVRFTVLRAP